MNQIELKRKESEYFHAVSEIVADVNHSGMSWPTVTRVRLTNDLSHLYIYVTFDVHPTQSLEALNKAKGFVRSQLASFSTQRKVPALHFEIDTSFEEGNKIEAILRQIKEKENQKK